MRDLLEYRQESKIDETTIVVGNKVPRNMGQEDGGMFALVVRLDLLEGCRIWGWGR